MNVADLNKASKDERSKMFYGYLIGLGFEVKSNTNYHYYCRHPDFKLDIWTSTAKMDVTETITGKTKRYNGYQSMLNAINVVYKLYLEN